MFVAALFLFIISTLAVDYIDQGRCVGHTCSISINYKNWVCNIVKLSLIESDTLFPYFRLVLDFDLFFYAFGQLDTVIWAWLIMFCYTLFGPYYILKQWRELHSSYQWKMPISVATAMVLLAAEITVLGYFPVYVVLHYQLPPASRLIIILEQVLR